MTRARRRFPAVPVPASSSRSAVRGPPGGPALRRGPQPPEPPGLARDRYPRGMIRTTLALTAVLGLAAIPRAQVGLGEVGFELISNQVTYGTLCGRTFSCTYLPADLHRGQNAELVVRGVHGQWFVIAVWFDVPHQCLAV